MLSRAILLAIVTLPRKIASTTNQPKGRSKESRRTTNFIRQPLFAYRRSLSERMGLAVAGDEQEGQLPQGTHLPKRQPDRPERWYSSDGRSPVQSDWSANVV